MIPKITHKELPMFIQLAVAEKENLLIVGKPGIGKTVGIFDFAGENHFDVELSHPAVEDPTNRLGIPAKTTQTIIEEPDELDMLIGSGETRTTVRDVATFLQFGQQLRLIDAKKDTIWFIDDFGMAPNAVQGSYMQFLGSRQLNDQRISDFIHIIAATNSREDRAGVKGLLEPIKSRFGIIVELVADVDSFRDFAYRKGLHSSVTDFLNVDPMALHDWNPNAGMENSTCPRLWEKLGKFVNRVGFENDKFLRDVCIATIGEKYGAKYHAFLKIYNSIPRYESIIADPEGFEVNHTLDVRYAIIGSLASQGKIEHSDKLFQVIRKFAKEYQVVFMRILSAMKSPLLSSRDARLWCAENATIYLSALSKGTTAF